jgi:uncharacterized LabA/DUF88 family protein
VAYFTYMSKTILFIDGENFRHKVEEVLKSVHKEKSSIDFASIELKQLIDKILKNYKISTRLYYGAKIREHVQTQQKSKELIILQRRLKTNLEQQGFDFVIAGNVRAQSLKIDGSTKLIFREKGVDVKIAVDLITFACDKKMKTAILCSSDSDLQPAVTELQKRKVKVIYLGFQMSPNKGLTYTTNETILFRNSEILKVCPKKKIKK